ncbi:MAG: aminoacyl-tRNA hydrolase [Candidatus Omnitrophota bacterium]
MKIIVGLGNPGLRYKNTRHNAGFLAIERLAQKLNIRLKKKGFQGKYGIGCFLKEEIMLFEPLTYMNLSGEAVKGVSSSKGIRLENELLVITDDFNLDFGIIRLRKQGSAGGHNGLKSIIGHLGKDFARLRIGIGEAPEQGDVSSYVLSRFSRKEKAELDIVLDEAIECVVTWISSGSQKAMSKYNK